MKTDTRRTELPAHSKLPWAIDRQGDIYSPEQEDGLDIVCFGPHHLESIKYWPANAEFIVKACNSHDALVAFARLVVGLDSGATDANLANTWVLVANQARALLSQLEAKSAGVEL